MKPQSMLFTIFGEYVRHYGDEIWVGSLTKLMGEFGMTEQAVRAAISRMLRQGWLESAKVGNRSYYTVSARGKKRLIEAAERIYKLETPNKWEGMWCIASYNIPEDQRKLRDQFRKELTFLGFGMLTTSAWIAPHNLVDRVKELSEVYGITNYVEIFTSKHVGWSDPKQLVSKCWNLDAINEAYKEFIDIYQPQLAMMAQKMKSNEEILDSYCFVEKTKLVHNYRKFLFIDPDLPNELLPDVWLGKEADRLFEDYHNLLQPGATRFFEEAYEPMPV